MNSKLVPDFQFDHSVAQKAWNDARERAVASIERLQESKAEELFATLKASSDELGVRIADAHDRQVEVANNLFYLLELAGEHNDELKNKTLADLEKAMAALSEQVKELNQLVGESGSGRVGLESSLASSSSSSVKPNVVAAGSPVKVVAKPALFCGICGDPFERSIDKAVHVRVKHPKKGYKRAAASHEPPTSEKEDASKGVESARAEK